MRDGPVSPRLVLAAAAAVLAVPVRGASPISALRPGGGARVTIRGSGSAISVERSGELALPAPAAPSPAVLDRAIAMKEAGTTDEAIVGYLQAHRSELPSFVDLDTVSALRRAGAGGNVIAYLSGVAAVEVGPTGAEGGLREEETPAAAPSPGEAEMTNELPASLAWGGVAIGAPTRGFHRHGFSRGRMGGPGPRTPGIPLPPKPRVSGAGRFPRR